MTRSHKLSQDLVAVKRKLGLSLIAFEDALIDLDPFIRVHPFETINFLTNSVVKHYTDELLSQAVLILGATDFLGNPIGFLNDIHEGRYYIYIVTLFQHTLFISIRDQQHLSHTYLNDQIYL